jgi:hypothetical protein
MSTKTEAGRAGHRELRSVFLAGPELRIRAEFRARWLPIESPGRPGRLSPLWERLGLDLSVGTAELRPQEARSYQCDTFLRALTEHQLVGWNTHQRTGS